MSTVTPRTHGDGESGRRRAVGHSRRCGLDHRQPARCVNGGVADAERSENARRAPDGRGDVVELQVDEDFESCRERATTDSGPAAENSSNPTFATEKYSASGRAIRNAATRSSRSSASAR